MVRSFGLYGSPANASCPGAPTPDISEKSDKSESRSESDLSDEKPDPSNEGGGGRCAGGEGWSAPAPGGGPGRSEESDISEMSEPSVGPGVGSGPPSSG